MKAKIFPRILSIIGFLLLVAPFYQQCVGMKQTEAPAEEAPVTTEVIPQGTDSITYARRSDSIQKAFVLQNVKDSIAAVKTQDSIERVMASYEKLYRAIDDEHNENAFEMAYQSFEFINIIFNDPQKYWNEFKEQNYNKSDLTYIVRPIWLVAFVFIIVFTFIGMIASFVKSDRLIYKMAKWNVILLSVAFGSIFLDCWFKQIDQFKWGYYLFGIVQFLIVYISENNLKGRINNP
jgi:hypothetical protein